MPPVAGVRPAMPARISRAGAAWLGPAALSSAGFDR
jgi:hypothetical protein